MTNYPITDPAEIAKLPDCTVYEAVDGTEFFYYKTQFNYLSDLCDTWVYASELVRIHGGIACRLVPEDQYELIRTQLEGHFSDMKAQRDELAELLREVAPSCYIEAVAGIPGDCGYCLNCKIIAKLEEHETN